jgi:hypothetical protein
MSTVTAVGLDIAKSVFQEYRSNRSNTWPMWTAPASQGCWTVF